MDLHYECHSKNLSELHKPNFRRVQFEMVIEYQGQCKVLNCSSFHTIYQRAR